MNVFLKSSILIILILVLNQLNINNKIIFAMLALDSITLGLLVYGAFFAKVSATSFSLICGSIICASLTI